MGDDLKQKMFGALTWSSADRFGQQAIQLIIGIVLSRLLSAGDFGLLGMVMIFAALSFVLVESGFGQALIRKINTNETDYNSIFYFNIFVSVVIYIALYFTSPFIAVFFKEPQLTQICRVLFLAVLFNALYLIPLSKLGKVLDYKTIAKVNLLSTGLSGVLGIVLAFLNYGVWSLVFQQVSYHFFRMLFFHFFVKWKPSLLFSFKVIKEFWTFSVHLLSTSVMNVIFNYLLVIILGKFYQKSEVGYYTMGSKLNDTFSFTFQSILLGSTFSLFSQIQNDDERFRRVFRRIANDISIVTFPILIGLIAAAQPLIEVVWSEKFLPSVPFFQLLCLASVFNPLYTLNTSALNARGKSKITFKIEMIKKAMILITMLFTFSFGVIAMLWGYVAASTFSYLVSILYLKSELGHYVKHQILDFIQSLFFGMLIAGFIFPVGLLTMNIYLKLLLQICSAAIIYFLIIKYFYKELYLKSIEVLRNAIMFKKIRVS